MKQNLKVNLVWLGLLVAGFCLDPSLGCSRCAQPLLYQILEQIELILSLQLV